jgi:hypothetical protein
MCDKGDFMSKWKLLSTLTVSMCVGALVSARVGQRANAAPKAPALAALDYQEIIQLTNRYAYGIDYADV